MRTLLAAALALALVTPALAQQSPPPAPMSPTAQGSSGNPSDKNDKAKKAKASKDKADKNKEQAKSNERSNKGGATRGEERAGQVKDMNSARKTN